MALIKKERSRTDGGQRLALGGEIDQDLDLADDLERPGVTVLDLDDVKRVTSFGVREWIRAVSGPVAGSLFLVNCRPAIVSQLNMVQGFAGNADVVSIYLPYICEACDTEFESVLDLRTDHDRVKLGEPPDLLCPKCGAVAEFDDSPSSYFSFVASRPPPKVPEVARLLISGEAAPPSLVVQKEVSKSVTALWFSGSLDGRARLKRTLDGIEGHLVVNLQGIELVAPGALAKLEPLFGPEAAKADVWLVGVRAGWLDDPAAAPFLAKARGRIIDFVAPVICVKCGAASGVGGDGAVSEGLIDDLDDIDSSLGQSTVCSTCGGPAVHATDAAGRARMKALAANADEVPPAVRLFLFEQREARTAHGRPITKVSVERSDSKTSRFTIVNRVGAGGMAEVFLAEQRGPAGFVKRLIVKRILPGYASSADFVEMFLNEARIAARINHPNVVQIFDLGEDAGHYFIAMEYVRGWDLSKILSFLRRTGQRMPIELACRVIADVAAGLHAAHILVDDKGDELSVVHRDVSPHNVLISTDGAVKITDFGVARVIATAPRTQTGALKGKIIYMAPEQIDGNLGAIDAQVDVFSTGIVLYEMLTQTQLFRRETEYLSVQAVLKAPVIPPDRLRPEIPLLLSAIVMQALNRDRGGRYASADVLRQDLERFILSYGKPSAISDFARWLKSLGSIDNPGVSMPTPGLTPSRSGSDHESNTDIATVQKPIGSSEK